LIRYPNGKPFMQTRDSIHNVGTNRSQLSHSNRGMTLEDDINETNNYYLERGIAVIHKKPTPIQIVKVDYPHRSAAVIKEAYFKQSSTTDYNGVYKGKYIDFEAKETKNKTSFPLQNFHDHQIKHMKNIISQDGLAFVIISAFDEIFFLQAEKLLLFWERKEQGGRKSITKNELVEVGYTIPLGYQPRIDYIKMIDRLYFSE
jgi:recombination protein U